MPTSELVPGFEAKILEEAIQSPAVAMMRLSLEVDRQLRLILAVIGQLKDYTGQSPSEALDLIGKSIEGSAIPVELRDTLKSFWNLRNMVVHGGNAQQGFAMRALDYGFRILRMLQAIPRPSYVVRASVFVCSDQACRSVRPDVRGVIIESFGAKGESHGRQIYPTSKLYTGGQSVGWEWDTSGPGWGETWYRDPWSGEIKSAWGESSEFIGRPLEEI
jgi:ribosomal protein S6E (S10)